MDNIAQNNDNLELILRIVRTMRKVIDLDDISGFGLECS